MAKAPNGPYGTGNGKQVPLASLKRNGSSRAIAKRVRSKSSGPPKGKTAQKRFRASIYSAGDLPNDFVDLIRMLEAELRLPIWFVIQNEMVVDELGAPDPFCNISLSLFKAFQKARDQIPEGKPVGLLLESPGGDAHAAFRISRLLQRRSTNFTAIIPQWAKSAATLLALGAHNLVIARQAELGPLDVQMFDPHKEEVGSALNAVQSLERLNAFAMTAVDQMMILVRTRFGRKVDVSLPLVLDYATKFTRPLLEKIDTVDYVRKSRELKVAEDYATRLMMPHYPISQAKDIARKLVQMYPTHGFVIDRDEAAAFPKRGAAYGLGLKIVNASTKAETIMRDLVPFLDSINASGRIEEVKP